MVNFKENVDTNKLREAEKLMAKFLVGKDFLLQHYEQIVEPLLIPDLYGKTVKVTKSNFPKIYHKKEKISKILDIKSPDIFIYEDFYYGADTVGLTKPWIEVSAKTIRDFTEKELTFLIARQISFIYLKFTINKVYAEQYIKTLDLLETTPGINIVNIFGTIDLYQKAFKLIYYNWLREVNHIADIYGLIFSGCIDSSISSIIKLIINDIDLAKKIKISEYLEQRDFLTNQIGLIALYTKLDEAVPYGPIRIAELLRFLSSSKNKKFFNSLKIIHEELNVV